MKILSIETSCDETAVSIVEAEGGISNPAFKVLGNALFSQITMHKEYGGVYPMLAKREHAKNLIPLLEKVLKESNLIPLAEQSSLRDFVSKENTEINWNEIKKILEKEDGLFESFKTCLENTKRPAVDVISVTSGPGLEPALWVGISFAKALGKLWNIPVIGTNHMEGHIASVLVKTEEFSIFNLQFSNDSNTIQFPALALLISGGHTELVEIEAWGKYKVIGETVDDAVGEAFDKVARLLGLPYPGGPEISKLAEYARGENIPHKAKLPRPMIHSKNLNFSFSGLKTAVLYYIRDNFHSKSQNMTEADKADLAREFEDAVVEVLLKKTEEALEEKGAKTLIVAGGVIANKMLRSAFLSLEEKFDGLSIKIPENSLATDNSVMIAMAGYINTTLHPELLSSTNDIIAQGNLKLGKLSLR